MPTISDKKPTVVLVSLRVGVNKASMWQISLSKKKLDVDWVKLIHGYNYQAPCSEEKRE